tara:strand:+ start:88 stop:510 length:423 start_codon:yes stop_codon:yes gene_type:complete
MKYKILKNGTILNTFKNIEATQRLNKSNGYMYVDLWVDKKAQTHSVHRLVAGAHLEPIDGCNIVDHIDGDKTNNNLSNLRYVTQRDNMRHHYGDFDNSNIYLTKNKRFRVRVTLNKKTKHIGVFDTIEQAKEARNNSYND